MHEATLFLKIIVVFRDCIQVLIKVMLRYLRIRKKLMRDKSVWNKLIGQTWNAFRVYL